MQIVLALTIRFALAWLSPFLELAPDPTALDLGARPTFSGVTSRYGDAADKRWGGQALACAPDVHIRGTMHVCAHRTLPCGTVLVVESQRTKRRTVCRVMDRGPYGALTGGHWHLKIHARDAGTWRGVLDLSPEAFADLGLHGPGPIKAWAIYRPKRRWYLRPKRRRLAV